MPADFASGGPGIGIEVVGMELVGELGVLVDGNLLVPLHPLAAAGNGVDAPMHEEAELGVAPPLDAGGCAGIGGHGSPLRGGSGGQADGEDQDGGDAGCKRFHGAASVEGSWSGRQARGWASATQDCGWVVGD